METLLAALSIAIGIYLSMNVGISTLGATIGIVRGSTNFDYRIVAAGAVIASVLGIGLLSGKIIETVSINLIRLDFAGMLSVLISVAIVATAIAIKGYPISTTYVAVGALSGFGLILNRGLSISVLEKIAISLLASPLIALVFGFVLFYLTKEFLKKELKGIQKIERFEMKFFIPGIIAMLVLSFVLGANSIGVVIGLLGSTFGTMELFFIGAAGVSLGVFAFGKKTSQQIGIELTDLSPSRGFMVMLVSGIVIVPFVFFGIPISTIQTILGALIGVSAAAQHIGTKNALRVSLAWLVFLPIAVMILSALIAGGIGFIM